MDLGPPISGASLGAVVGIMVAVMSSPSSNKGAQIGGYALAGLFCRQASAIILAAVIVSGVVYGVVYFQ